ncbi:MAG: DUF6398 domain-containing protein, partial [Planctomycetota bacterium]
MKKKKKTKRNKKPGKEILAKIYNESWKAADKIVELTDAFCLNHLNEDYRELCEDMIAALLDVDVPLEKGRPASWASGIVYALGRVNFLQDPGQSPHMTSTQLAEGFGVSQAAMRAKAKIIREELDLIQLHPDWCIPAMLEDNPLVWMLKVNGLVMDIRTAPREAQEEAYRLGLIPYIPADAREPEPRLDSETEIIKFPSGQNDTPKPESVRKTKDDGPDLFEG